VRQGRFTLYKSRPPAEVYWLSIDGQPPIRCVSKEEVRAVIRRMNGGKE
jgi:hypothetical protein